MARSYKKTPYAGEKKGKAKKRIANHIVRQKLKDNPELICNKGSYKKIYCSWNICDYSWTCSWEDYWKSEIETHRRMCWLYPNYKEPYPNKKECYRQWQRWYKDK